MRKKPSQAAAPAAVLPVQSARQNAAVRRSLLARAYLEPLVCRKATVRAICREAGLNDRYLYAAFNSARALLSSTCAHHSEQL